MSKFTLGPWRVNNHDPRDIYGSYRGRDQLLATAYREYRGRNTSDDGEEAEANARLISAAPDLVEALENLYSVSVPFQHDSDTVWQAVKEQVLGVLAKIEGKS